MPLRKEPKETVVYPASKRKVPAFKPLRPSKVARTDSEGSGRSQTAHVASDGVRRQASPQGRARQKDKKQVSRRVVQRVAISDSEEEEGEEGAADGAAKTAAVIFDDELGLDMMEDTTPLSAALAEKAERKKPPRHEPSPMPTASKSSEAPTGVPSTAAATSDTILTRPEDIASIPQPLLLRLLHEGFNDENTRIDTHAIQVFQKYVEIFVREAIARAQLEKQQAVESEEVNQMDARWLEVEDLEKAAPALFLDF